MTHHYLPRSACAPLTHRPHALLLIAVAFVGLFSALGITRDPAKSPATTPDPTFIALDVTVDAGERSLGSYQCEITAPPGWKLVGVEGGTPAGGYSAAPFYDPAALKQERVIIAAIATGADTRPLTAAPTGKVRVARLHLAQIGGTPADVRAMMIAAGNAQAERLLPLPTITLAPATAESPASPK